MCQIPICPLAILLVGANFVVQTSAAPVTSKNEMLVPKHSTTVLLCDPLHNENEEKKTATWYKDGYAVATVTSGKNAILHDRPYTAQEPLPEVGFLVVTDISELDEGNYWCQRDDTGQIGEISHLTVAYITPLDSDQSLTVTPHSPLTGQYVTIDCPFAKGMPKPAMTWKHNNDSVDFANGNVEVLPNGTLTIHRFDSAYAGTYECTFTNFAGHTSAKVFLPPPTGLLTSLADTKSSMFMFTSSCAIQLRNGVLWFLCGCMATSCLVLLYLLGGMICYRHSTRSTRGRFSALNSFLLADPTLAPGFRKVVAPTPDIIQTTRTSSRAILTT